MKHGSKRACAGVAGVAGVAVATVMALTSLALGQDAEPQVVDPPSLDAPVASAVVSSRNVVLGRSFLLVIRVVHARGIEISLPTNLSFGDALEELRRTDASAPNPDGTVTREFELEVIAFELGAVTIPPIEVTYTGRREMSVVRTNPIAFEVSGVIGDGEGELRDIAPPVVVKRRDYTVLYIAGAVIVALFLLLTCWLIIRSSRRRRANRGLLASRRLLPPDEEALARLRDLEADGATEIDDLKSTYLEMSEIIKTYIARRFGFPASELTTLEIRNELAARPAGEEAEALIRGWLEGADLVKFANQRATSDEARRALYDARTFVEKTRRAKAEAEREEEPDA